jgi:hypothetical protein
MNQYFSASSIYLGRAYGQINRAISVELSLIVDFHEALVTATPTNRRT